MLSWIIPIIFIKRFLSSRTTVHLAKYGQLHSQINRRLCIILSLIACKVGMNAKDKKTREREKNVFLEMTGKAEETFTANVGRYKKQEEKDEKMGITQE